ncbi:MAG: patatin-like phospholipase family protein [Solirubrobacteraceae bacterium]|jgi:predicted acylesterase/phospholipase RssA
MGTLVPLEPVTHRPAADRGAASKVALVLGGGGVTGGVYAVGALRALDLLSVNMSVNQFDVFLGTSSGSFVAALAANGVTSEEMMQVVLGERPTAFRDLDAGTLLPLNVSGLVRSAIGLPRHLLQLSYQLATARGGGALVDALLAFADSLPAGFATTAGIERYLREVLADPERSDDFRTLARELYIVATDLDSCERIIFGEPGWDDVPISRAVSASSALPVLYAPVRIGDRELIDGGIVSTTNLDVAAAHGATLIIVVNPLVPFSSERPGRGGRGAGRVSDFGFSQIAYQSFKLLAHQRLHERRESWAARFPGVDIVLIEPDRDDKLMFETSLMSYSSRIEIAKHGFRSVTHKLAGDYDRLKEVCARHGVEISAERVRGVLEHFAPEQERSQGWRRIFEQTTGAVIRQAGGS